MLLTDEQAKSYVAANVRRLLRDRGWRQADLARATGETEMRVSRCLRAEHVPSVGLLKRFAEALGTTMDELTDPPPGKPPAN